MESESSSEKHPLFDKFHKFLHTDDVTENVANFAQNLVSGLGGESLAQSSTAAHNSAVWGENREMFVKQKIGRLSAVYGTGS